MGMKRIERLWDLVRHGSLLRVICASPNCGRVSILDPAALRDRLRASPMIDQIKFRCERCGGSAIHWDAVQFAARPTIGSRPIVLIEEQPHPRRDRDRDEPERPPATLAGFRRETSWVHWYCETPGCGFHTPLALAPYIMLWGPDASGDRLRNNLGCPLCGTIGGSIRHPSWGDREIGWQPYPTDIPTMAPTIHAVPRRQRRPRTDAGAP